MKGALLGLVINLIAIPARLVILWQCMRQRGYSWWIVTPDDPVSPFGQYEPTVRKVYERFGRRVGDFYWLGWRNVLYGLRHRLKPDDLLPSLDPMTGNLNYWYQSSVAEKEERGRFTVYRIGCYKMLRADWFEWRGRKYAGFFGWKIDRIVDDPYTARREINMEGRPIFSPLRVG